MFHVWDGRHTSWSSGYEYQYEVLNPQSGNLEPWYLISADILHIVTIITTYLSFLSKTLPSSQNTKLSYTSLSLHAIVMS